MRATPQELRDEPDRYNCERCSLRLQTAALWRVNTEAWRIYQTLCGRMVGLCDLQGLVLERLTETWPTEDVIDLLKRLDLILKVLNPKGAP